MYPHFIEVHSPFDDERMMMNIETIRMVTVNKGVTNIYQNGISVEDVKESYDEVKKLIRDSGCLINKGDPRLETQHQLTLEDLKDMIGEPVWNSNLMRWHLVEKIEPDEYRGSVVILKGTHSQVWYYDSADLIRHPLYRMKEAE